MNVVGLFTITFSLLSMLIDTTSLTSSTSLFSGGSWDP
jgi:hypothetical protein